MYHKIKDADSLELQRWISIFESLRLPENKYAITLAYINNYIKNSVVNEMQDENLLPFAIKIIRDLDFRSGDVVCAVQPVILYEDLYIQVGTLEVTIDNDGDKNVNVLAALEEEVRATVQKEIDEAESSKKPFVLVLYMLPSSLQLTGVPPVAGKTHLRYAIKTF